MTTRDHTYGMLGPIETHVAKSAAPHPGEDGPPTSDAEAALVEMLRSHGGREGEMLATYAELAEHCGDPGVRYLVGLLLEDEERHHRQIEAMLNSVTGFRDAGGSRRPRIPLVSPPLDPDLVATTRRLLAFEQEDATQLRKLEKALGSTHMPRLFRLLVELMRYDTAKHVAILEFVSRTHKE